MQKNENETRGLSYNSMAMNPGYNMPNMSPTPYTKDDEAAMMQYQLVYPELFYKLQPYVMMVCDQMDYGSVSPSMEMVGKMTDNIYDDVVRMYPDIAEYAEKNQSEAIPTINGDPPQFGRRFRRRGVLRDVIEILLLSELFGRRRRRY